ncbi:MAG: glycoside hydrolase family 3 C-terminal domain-containing protein [Anaerolineales bacterium]|nr:glycoside hydrolase family 3 C-terminal domain-containing protein [Anaerolineales bacterium]
MDIEKRVADLLEKLTLDEKVSLLSGRDLWFTVPIERLGIPSIVMTDGPHGVRSADPETGRPVGPVTAFPPGISMGACWDPELVEQVAQALGEETRGMDCDILLGPCVNIVRHPLGGRNFETYSEDPYLTGRTAVAYIRGLQSRGVGASLKHYAVNNYEIERFRASSEVDERTLREIYLPHFEMAVKEARPWTVMCSYNRINGVYASQHDYLLNQILKDEWGFSGALISDWGANHTVYESIAGGLDLEMPGPAKYHRYLRDAVEIWQIDPAAVDEAVRRVLRLVMLSGRMEKKTSKGSVNTRAHQVLARRLAEGAITLLKNDGGVLPLKGIQSVAVIGPNAAEAVLQGGGSSRVPALYRVSPLQALKERLAGKVELVYEPGGDNYDEPSSIPPSWLEGGLQGQAFAAADLSGEAMLTRNGLGSDFWMHTAWMDSPVKPRSFRWTGTLTVPESGTYKLSLHHMGTMRVLIDGKAVLDSRASQPKSLHPQGFKSATIACESGKNYALTLEYVRPLDQEVVAYSLGMGPTFVPGPDPRPGRAVEAARRCDVAVVFAGYPEAFETEGTDRPTMHLLGGQDELIAAVAAANPRTVVVLNAGAPVAMPWLDQVAAVVLAYYPGQENGNAVASVLLGEVNPSGKLPVTFPQRLEDSPAYLNNSYPGCREVIYGEGVYVGYRYFDAKGVAPLFPFGHGLSYTQFAYSELKVPKKVRAGEKVRVSLKVKNTGRAAGKEVVQLYVADPQSSLPRPPKELKGFAKLALKPGQAKTVSFTLDERSLAYYDPVRKAWVAEPGEFEVLAGSSSADIRVRAKFSLA